jgi:hypothetical protein
MIPIQSTVLKDMKAALDLYETDEAAFWGNLKLSLGFMDAATKVASILVAEYHCPNSKTVLKYNDGMVWHEDKNIVMHGKDADIIKRWEDSVSFNAREIMHDGITVLCTKASLIESMEDMGYRLDDINLCDFIPDWKDQVVERVAAKSVRNIQGGK